MEEFQKLIKSIPISKSIRNQKEKENKEKENIEEIKSTKD